MPVGNGCQGAGCWSLFERGLFLLGRQVNRAKRQRKSQRRLQRLFELAKVPAGQPVMPTTPGYAAVELRSAAHLEEISKRTGKGTSAFETANHGVTVSVELCVPPFFEAEMFAVVVVAIV